MLKISKTDSKRRNSTEHSHKDLYLISFLVCFLLFVFLNLITNDNILISLLISLVLIFILEFINYEGIKGHIIKQDIKNELIDFIDIFLLYATRDPYDLGLKQAYKSYFNISLDSVERREMYLKIEAKFDCVYNKIFLETVKQNKSINTIFEIRKIIKDSLSKSNYQKTMMILNSSMTIFLLNEIILFFFLPFFKTSSKEPHFFLIHLIMCAIFVVFYIYYGFSYKTIQNKEQNKEYLLIFLASSKYLKPYESYSYAIENTGLFGKKMGDYKETFLLSSGEVVANIKDLSREEIVFYAMSLRNNRIDSKLLEYIEFIPYELSSTLCIFVLSFIFFLYMISRLILL